MIAITWTNWKLIKQPLRMSTLKEEGVEWWKNVHQRRRKKKETEPQDRR
jgi:hypothetical protein